MALLFVSRLLPDFRPIFVRFANEGGELMLTALALECAVLPVYQNEAFTPR